MSTGHRRIIQNTRERVVSADINRLQTFEGGDENNAYRGQMLRPVDDFAYIGTTFTAPGPASAAIDISTVTAPLYGGVIDGLMVVVPATGVSVNVTPGEVLLIDPDGQPGSSNPNPPNPDDPICKYVNDAGITGLAWTPYAGPGFRVDVVEVQRTDVVTESDNRDIYNETTGAFNPALVSKVAQGKLAYRIRLGLAGGGLPAPALGWFPLAVLSTPAGAPNLDTVTVWDVRNLLSDKASSFMNRSSAPTKQERARWLLDVTPFGQLRLSGQIVTNVFGERQGGVLLDTLTATPYLRLDTAAYQAAGFVLTPNLLLYVYALFPVGYPRWVQYYFAATPGAGGRTPGPYRGIIAISHTASFDGVPTLPIPVPLSTGLAVSTLLGSSLAQAVVAAGPTVRGACGDSDKIYVEGVDAASVSWRPPVVAVISGVNPYLATMVFTPGTDFPAGATRIRVLFATTSTIAAPAGSSNLVTKAFFLINPGVFNYVGADQMSSVVIRDALSTLGVEGFTVELPTISDGLSQPSGPVSVQIKVTMIAGSVAAGVLASCQGTVIGWSFDP